MKTYFEYIAPLESPPHLQEDDSRFTVWIQLALLLSLKDQGFLTDLQYRYTEELLKKRTDTPYSWSQQEFRHA